MVRSAHILIACAATLLGIGVVMVHSAGSVVGGPDGTVVDSTFGPAGPWTLFASKTSLYAGIAIVVMLIASRLNVRQLFTARGVALSLIHISEPTRPY